MQSLLVFIFFFTISESTLFAQRIPRVNAQIGMGSDSMKTAEFATQLGVQGYVWVNDVHAESLRVDSFTLLIVHDTSVIFCKKNIGNYFDADIKKFLNKIRTGDKILVYDIYTTLFNKQKRLMPPLEYILK